MRTLQDQFRKIKAIKLEEIKQGKEGSDLYSILLREGGDVYGPLGEKADDYLFDDIKLIYTAAVATTQISVNNVMKYVHMDKYRPVKDKLIKEVDTLMNFDCWDVDGNQINHDQLLEACSFENIQESFDYTMMCFRESLRIEAPINSSSAHTVTKDVILARGTPKELKIDAGDSIFVL